MSDEETPVVDELKADADGKHPETVSWNQYVGIKESLGKKLDTATAKVGTLEEQLKGAISTDDHNKVKGELEEAKTKLQTATDELTGIKEKSVSEKRETLIKRGVSEEKVKAMSETELNGAMGVLDSVKPKPDLSPGGGGGEQSTKAKDKMRSGFDSLHPQK